MMTLALETSDAVASIAISRDGQCLEEAFLSRRGGRHAQTLVPEILALLARHRLAIANIDRVAVSAGPGSFTGLRIGVTCGKALAYAASRPLVTVDTFDALAIQVSGGLRLALLGDAQQAGLLLALYERSAGEGTYWIRRDPIGLVTMQDLRALLQAGDVVTGPASSRLPAEMREEMGIAAPPAGSPTPRAAAIALLADTGRATTADPFAFEPVYVRRSGAEEKLAAGLFRSRA